MTRLRRVDWLVVWIVVCAKIIVLATIAIAYHVFPFLSWTYYTALHYPSSEGISLQTAYKTWDAQHFIFLSQVGYHPAGPSNDYYPLLPALIHLVALPLRSPLAAGLLISNSCSLVGVYYLYLFVLRMFQDRRTAVLSVLLMVAFPTSFFLSLVYSESLFLMLAICFFYYLYANNYPVCSICAFLLALARPLGVLIIVPWLIFHVAAGMNTRRTTLPTRASWRGSRRYVRSSIPRRRKSPPQLVPHTFGARSRQRPAYMLAPLVGYAVYLLNMLFTTGNALSAFTQEQSSIGAWHVSDILRPDLLVSNFFLPFTVQLPDFGFTAPTASPLDRVFFLLFLVGLPLVALETDIVLLSFYVLLGSVPILGSFMSYSRYLMPAFPLYVAFAKLASTTQRRFAVAIWLLVGFAGSLILVSRHALGYWVG